MNGSREAKENNIRPIIERMKPEDDLMHNTVRKISEELLLSKAELVRNASIEN